MNAWNIILIWIHSTAYWIARLTQIALFPNVCKEAVGKTGARWFWTCLATRRRRGINWCVREGAEQPGASGGGCCEIINLPQIPGPYKKRVRESVRVPKWIFVARGAKISFSKGGIYTLHNLGWLCRAAAEEAWNDARIIANDHIKPSPQSACKINNPPVCVWECKIFSLSHTHIK